MVELWASFVVWSEYIIPAVLLLVGIVTVIVVACIGRCRWERKTKYLAKHGFERYLIGVPAFGNGAFYGWRNDKTGQRFDERSLKSMDYSDLVLKVETR